MSQHLPEEFGPLELEGSAPESHAAVRDHLAACAACARRFSEREEAFALLALGLAPVAPPPALWARLSAHLDGDVPLEALLPQAAALLDLPESAARAVLARVGRAEGWLDGPAPGCWYQEVEKGPRRAGALTALVKLAPRASFPRHRHLGAERALVLRGAYHSEAGRHAAGELHAMDAESTHTLTAEPGAEAVYLAVVEGGVEVAGQFLRPAR